MQTTTNNVANVSAPVTNVVLHRLDYGFGGAGPRCVCVPMLPASCGTVDMLPDGLWASGTNGQTLEWEVYQLCFGQWVRVTCPATLEWFNGHNAKLEIEYDESAKEWTR